MADYCSLSDIQANLPESGLSASSDYDTMIGTAITAVSRMIDRECGKWENYFYPSTADETRYFDGSGDEHLWIDEAVSITTVSVSEQGSVTSSDYTDWTSTDYMTWPYNRNGNLQPIMRLDVDVYNGSKAIWYEYPRSVRVVGVFGYAATPPADIKQAAIIQTTRWYMRGKQAYQDGGGGQQTGSMLYTKLDMDVAEMLLPYRVYGNA